MEKKLYLAKTEYCVKYANMLPFITPKIMGKHLFTSHWLKDRMEASRLASTTMNVLVRTRRLIRAKSKDAIYLRLGKDKRIGMQYFFHNQALNSFLVNLDLHGYAVKYGGLNEKFPNSDGILYVDDRHCMGLDPVAIELDTGCHGPLAIHEQIMKYEKSPFRYILYVTYPTSYYYNGNDENYEQQAEQEKNLRRKMKTHKIPKELREKILSTTYAQATDPTRDPLKEKIWRTLNGTYTTVL